MVVVHEKIDPRGVSAWRAFLATHALLVDHVDRYMESRGHLASASMEILSAISKSPRGAMRMSDLAKAVVMSPSGLTRHVDRLVQSGLIERAACPTDRRSTFAVITPEGSKLLKSSWPSYEEAIRLFLLQPLTCEDLGSLDLSLSKIRQHFQGCPDSDGLQD